MWEWIADKLGIAGGLPFVHRTLAFGLTVFACVISYAASDKPWAWAVFAISIVLAIYSFAQSFAGAAAGFGAAFLSFNLPLGIETALTNLRLTHIGCVVLERRSAAECLDPNFRQPKGAPDSSIGQP